MNQHRTGPGDVGAETVDSSRLGESGTGDATPRARVYRILGEQFIERPSRERVDAVGVWASEWRSNARSLRTDLEAALRSIEEGAGADEEGAGADEETLRTAYTHLFRGVSRQASPEPPYESLYRDGQFYSDTTLEIRQGYHWAGVDVGGGDRNEPPDHLGLQLQFMGELVAMAGRGERPGGREPAEAMWWLLDEHLTEWLPRLQARLEEESVPAYYQGLIELTRTVVSAHHEDLGRRRSD